VRVVGLLGRVALVALLVGGMLVLAYPGYRESHFPDARVARQSGQARGIPTFMPDAAKDISLLTNLDTMQSWGCFQLPSGMKEFQMDLAAEGAVHRGGQSLPKAEKMLGWVTWWPAAMSETGIDRYDLPSRASGGPTMIGLSARDNRVCFYGGGNAG
jgi:hypothetical protein